MKNDFRIWTFPKRFVAIVAFFAYTIAFYPLLYASVAPVQQQSEMWKTVSQNEFVNNTYGNLANQFERPAASWKLRGSFNALDATWKDEKLSYELFLFETSGRLSLAGDIDTIEESCCFDVGFDLQAWRLVVSGDEKELDAFEWNVDTANKTYAQLEHLRSSSESLLANFQNGANSGSAESGFASSVSSEKRYDYTGTRTNKYTARSETLYFNQFYAMRFDNLVGYGSGQAVKHIYLGDTRIVTKLNTVRSGTWSEEVKKQYFYHSDHLGSASLISDCDGKEYQRIEYTPYGETWVEKTQNTGMEYLPYKFTGKERDEETGLYYFGARYLDAKYSRWISTDPALGDYIPLAPIDDEAKKHNSQLPGQGGIYNHINLQLYHYSANNPVTYKDPDGEFIIMAGWSTTAGAGNAVSDNTGFFVCIPGDGKPVTVGAYTVNATGAYLGYGISAGGEITLAPFADEFSDISGFSMVGGGSGLKFSALPMITWGLEVGANPYSETLGDFIQSITIAVSGTKSLSRVPSTPIEGHLYTAWTKKIWEVEVGEAKTKITQTVNKYLDRKDYEGLVNYLKQLHKSLVPACEE